MGEYWPVMLFVLGLALLGLASLLSRGRSSSDTNSEHDRFGPPRGPADSIDATAAAIAAYHQVQVEREALEQPPHVSYGQEPADEKEPVKLFWKASYQIVAIYEGGGQFQNEGVYVQRNCTRRSFVEAWEVHCQLLTVRLGTGGGKLLSVAITGYISEPSDEFGDLSYTYPVQ